MKNITKTLCFILFTLQVNCQITQVIPLNYINLPSNGTYLKDLDNILPFWDGTWKGIINDKEYTFKLLKIEQNIISYSNGRYFYEDKLTCNFKVIDLTHNLVLFTNLDDISLSDGAKEIFFLSNRLNEYHFYYRDNQSNNCNNRAEFTLVKNNSNPNEILYKEFEYSEYRYWDCPYANQEDIPMFLPKVDLVLTRQ